LAGLNITFGIKGIQESIAAAKAALAGLKVPPMRMPVIPPLRRERFLAGVSEAVSRIRSEIEGFRVGAPVPAAAIRARVRGGVAAGILRPAPVGRVELPPGVERAAGVRITPLARAARESLVRALEQVSRQVDEALRMPVSKMLKRIPQIGAEWQKTGTRLHATIQRIQRILAERMGRKGLDARTREALRAQIERLNEWRDRIRQVGRTLERIPRETEKIVTQLGKEVPKAQEDLRKRLITEFLKFSTIPKELFKAVASRLGISAVELARFLRAGGAPGAEVIRRVGLAERREAVKLEQEALRRRITDLRQEAAERKAHLRERMQLQREAERAEKERLQKVKEAWSNIVSAVRGFWSAIQRGYQTAKTALTAPLTFLHNFQMEIRRTLFSVLLFWYSAHRFLEPATKLIRMVQTATIISGKGFENWGKTLAQVSELATRFAIPVENIARGLVEVSKAGYNADESMKILSASIAYATIMNEDMGAITGQIITTLKAFGWGAERASEVTNLLYAAVTRSKLSVKDLGTALNYAAAAASTANISLKETLAVTMFWADKGIRASRIGTGFRRMLDGISRAAMAATGAQMSMAEATAIIPANWEKIAEAIEKGGDRLSALRLFLEGVNKIARDGIDIMERAAIRAFVGVRAANMVIMAGKEVNRIYGEYMRKLEGVINLEEQASKISQTWAGLFTVVNNLWLIFRSSFVEGMGEVGGLAFEQLGKVGKRVQEIGREIGERVRQFFAPLLGPEGFKDLEDVVTRLRDFVMGFLSTLLPNLRKAFETIFGNLDKLSPERLGRILGALIGGIVRGLTQVTALVIKGITWVSEMFGRGQAAMERFSNLVADITALVGKLKLMLDVLLSPAFQLLLIFKGIASVLTTISMMRLGGVLPGIVGTAPGLAGGAAAGARGVAAGRGLLGALGGIGLGPLLAAAGIGVAGGLTAYYVYESIKGRVGPGAIVERAMAERLEAERELAERLREGERIIRERRFEAWRQSLGLTEEALEEEATEVGSRLGDTLKKVLGALGDNAEKKLIEAGEEARVAGGG